MYGECVEYKGLRIEAIERGGVVVVVKVDRISLFGLRWLDRFGTITAR